ncbi:MAG TPA: hypothetical protein VIV60_22135, partial [Polyangiaceae bacterium]
GAVVVGFRYQEDGPHLRMQPFEGGEGCNVGRAYRCIVFNRLPNEPQLIAYLDEIGPDNRGTLYFTNHDCQVVYGGIEDAELPARLFDSPPGFVVLAGDKLLDIDPFRKKTRVIDDHVRNWSGAPDATNPTPMWYVADGQLVVLDETRQERLRIGHDVSEVVFEASDPTRGLFLVDGGSLTRYSEATGAEPQLVADGVCGVSLGSYGVSYYSPCADRTLVVHDIDRDSKFEIDSGVIGLLYAQLRNRSDGSGLDVEAVYTKASSTDEGYQDLWLKQVSEPPQIWQRRLGRFIAATTGPNPTLTAIVDSDGNTGRLMRVDSEGEHTICTGVSLSNAVSPVAGGWMLVTDLVDGYGNLTLVSTTGEKKVILAHVRAGSSPKAPVRDPDLTGITDQSYFNLSAYSIPDDQDQPTIALLDPARLDSPITLGKSVPESKFGFFKNMTAVGYLDSFDPEADTGTLTVYQTRIGATSVVSKNVNDFAELLWPYEGVIYSVKQGDNYSTWAARSKP